MTGYSEQSNFRKLLVAPVNLRQKFLELIEREIKNTKLGVEGHLIFKLNALVDPVLITALYEASRQGVKIDLIVRGNCCLIPQVPGLSENVRVISIVGRYLEHNRIYYFFNNGDEDIYCGSADLMQRNLDRRVEIVFPIQNHEMKRFLKEQILDICLKDNVKSRILLPTGNYVLNHPVYTEKEVGLHDRMMKRTDINTKKILSRELH